MPHNLCLEDKTENLDSREMEFVKPTKKLLLNPFILLVF